MALGFTNVRVTVIMVLVMTFIFVIGSNNFIASSGCEDDISSLISQCTKSVLKVGKQIPPSSECCSVVKKTDVPCLCKSITPY
ncbi:hypothetical protein RND81_03G139400 [Saponaria officinalis]|uniref:Bifunctional inhibitor/plant lipid transfer protein/seed storage helical domain-containing protein n=1 Tax=Saponaria officinalis TaxID=3572 RepID=A0AAW1M053_SAPOF